MVKAPKIGEDQSALVGGALALDKQGSLQFEEIAVAAAEERVAIDRAIKTFKSKKVCTK